MHIKEIFDIIDNTEETSVDGIKSIIGFIVGKTDIDENTELVNEDVESDAEKLFNFKVDLKAYADKHGLKVLDEKGWTKGKIKWMALNDRKCACAPDTRVCPCQEGLIEIEQTGRCKCSIFSK